MKYSASVVKWVDDAAALAKKQGYSSLQPHHFIGVITSQDTVLAALRRAQVDLAAIGAIEEEAERRYSENPVKVSEVSSSPQVDAILQEAKKHSENSNHEGIVGTQDLFVALTMYFPELGRAGVMVKKEGNSVLADSSLDKMPSGVFMSAPLDGGSIGKWCVDLTEQAEKGLLPSVVGRDKEIRTITKLMSRRGKNTPVLIGEPGVGKTSVINSLAQRVHDGEIKALAGKRMVLLDLASLRSGSDIKASFENKFISILNEVRDSDGEIILVIEGIHALNSGSAAADALKPFLVRENIMVIGETTTDKYREHVEKEAVARYMQPVVIEEPSIKETMTILRGLAPGYQQYHGVLIHDDALLAAAELSTRYVTSRFLPDKAIDLVDEAAAKMRQEMDSKPDSIYFLERELAGLLHDAESLEGQETIESRVSLDNVRARIVEVEEELAGLQEKWSRESEKHSHLSDLREQLKDVEAKYQEHADAGDIVEADSLSEKIHELSQEATEVSGYLSKSSLIPDAVNRNEIANIIEAWTGIKAGKVLEEEADKLLRIEEEISKRLIGQKEAVNAVADAIRLSRAGLADPNRPTGAFLFSGSSGVGKTELAKSLAEFLFDDEKAIIRFDMSEYSEEHSVAKLIGAPPGYAGTDQGGQLTNSVREKPYSVVLFDEVEKANPRIFDTLLQVLDDGRLTDGQGKTTNFKNTIIILTSNLGSRSLSNESLTDAEREDAVNLAIEANFRPEFLGRLSKPIIFKPLLKGELKQILDLEIEKISSRVASRRIKFVITDDAKEWLASEGYSPEYGARPLQRLISQTITKPASRMILSGEIDDDDIVTISHEDDSDTLTLYVEKREYEASSMTASAQAILAPQEDNNQEEGEN